MKLYKFIIYQLTYIIDNEQIILQIVFTVRYLLISHVFPPHSKRLPHAELAKRLYLDEDLVIPVLLLPASQSSVLRLVIPEPRDTSRADSVEVVGVRILVVYYLRGGWFGGI